MSNDRQIRPILHSFLPHIWNIMLWDSWNCTCIKTNMQKKKVSACLVTAKGMHSTLVGAECPNSTGVKNCVVTPSLDKSLYGLEKKSFFYFLFLFIYFFYPPIMSVRTWWDLLRTPIGRLLSHIQVQSPSWGNDIPPPFGIWSPCLGTFWAVTPSLFVTFSAFSKYAVLWHYAHLRFIISHNNSDMWNVKY